MKLIVIERPLGTVDAVTDAAFQAPRGCEVAYDHEAGVAHILIGKNRRKCFACGERNDGWEREPIVRVVVYTACGTWEE